MGYSDFWFIDKRVQTTNLKRWFLWAILLFVFVGVCTYVCVNSMYLEIKQYKIISEVPTITVSEAKATNVNGYVKGTVANQTETELNGKYIKFIFYAENNSEIGTEYVEIGTLKPQETKTYEAKFRYQSVEKFIVMISDSNK